MRRKLALAIVAAIGFAMMALQGCFYSSPSPYYYGNPGYGWGGYNGYNGGGVTYGSCNPRNDTCIVCDSAGHHCHPVRS